MVRLPEPAELAVLLFRADWTTLSLSATLRHEADGALRARLLGEQAARRQPRPLIERPSWWPFGWPEPGQDQHPGGDPSPPAADGDDDEVDEEEPAASGPARVLIAPGGRYRVEYAGAAPSLCDGEWAYEVGAGRATRSAAAGPPGPLAHLLCPGRLLPTSDFRATGVVEPGGRTAYQVTVSARPGARDSGSLAGELYDELLLVVDAGLGILLRYEERAGGQQLSLMELADLVPDPPEGAAPDRFRPPRGMPVTAEPPLCGAGVTLPGLPGQAARAAAGLVSSALGFAIRHAPHGRVPAADVEPMPGPATPASWQPVSDELVNLLHRTGLPGQDFTAEMHQWIDGAAAMAGLAQLRDELPPMFAGIFGADAVWDAAGERVQKIAHEAVRLQVAPGGRYRIDRIDRTGDGGRAWRTMACDGERVWKVYRDRTATGPAEPLPHPYPSLIDPAWSLDPFVLTAGGQTAVAGRRGILVRAGHRTAGLSWRALGRIPQPVLAAPLLLGGGHTDLVVDPELGIVLRMTTCAGDQVVACYELRNISAGTDPAAFTVEVAPGTRTVRTGVLNEAGLASPATAVKTAAGLGLAGVAALAGWVQKRPSQPQPPPDRPGGHPDRYG